MATLPFESRVNVTQAGKMYAWDGWCEATSETMRERQRVKGRSVFELEGCVESSTCLNFLKKYIL